MVIESDAPPPNPVADFEDFFKNFEDVPNQAKYRQKISDAYGKSEHFIKILFEDVLNFDPTLANYLKNQPERALQDAADAFKNILRIDSGGTLNPDDEYFVRISTLNNSNELKLRSIRAKHIDKLIYVKGIIIRASAVHPQITIASFECPICGNLMQEPQLSKKLVMPKECTNPNCKHNKDFKILTQDSHFIDNQIITIQEAPEELRAGAIPQVLQAILLYDLVDTVRPGERVKIMGVLKSIPHEDGRGKMSVIFNTQLNVNNVEGLQQQDDEIDITQQDLEEIRSLSQEPEIQKKIARSISRAILGHDHLKMAAALSLFAGIEKNKKDGSKIRGDIHVMFMGDPGTGKSQILQSCSQIASRSIYTSGKGASAAGLTAAVVRENDNVGMQLEAGALVLASGGCACIDEFDKMKESDRVAIHEAMEQQSYHPLFEFTLANGQKQKIGSFIDGIFQKYPERIIEGVNCQIVPIDDLVYKIHSTDFKSICEININRVSRHEAPKEFIEITYSNGISITVTPEHPVYYYENQKLIKTMDARDIKEGYFIPACDNSNPTIPKIGSPFKIQSVKTIKNSGKYKTDWVYDVTIEPTRNFISHGLVLHNTVSIAKAGIVATLQAKTAIIAAANPKLGRWNNYATAIENINLPPTILSRFDLIFVVHDTPERANDDRIAEYILKNHMDDNLEDESEAPSTAQKKEDYIPMELLKKYIRHAKNVSKPKLTKETAKKIRDFYVSLRNAGGDNTSGITIVARNLDGIVRMCEAYAKMAIRDIVTPQDVDIILDLVKQSQHDIGYDPETGTTDMDVLLTGTSSNKRNRLNAILNKINELQSEDPKRGLEFEDIFEPLATMEGITEDFVKQALGEWVKDGTLYNPKPNRFALTTLVKKGKKNKDEEPPQA